MTLNDLGVRFFGVFIFSCFYLYIVLWSELSCSEMAAALTCHQGSERLSKANSNSSQINADKREMRAGRGNVEGTPTTQTSVS